MKNIIGLVSGIVFGMGLAVSGMTDTAKVQGFLDLLGAWDYSLAIVMASALAVTVPAWRLIRGKTPWYAGTFSLPSLSEVDTPLLLGALLFGIGWGLYGYCPGPAVAAIAYGKVEALVFVLMMALGMFLTDFVQNSKQVKGVSNV